MAIPMEILTRPRLSSGSEAAVAGRRSACCGVWPVGRWPGWLRTGLLRRGGCSRCDRSGRSRASAIHSSPTVCSAQFLPRAVDCNHPVTRLGCLGHIGVVLACEPAVRRLDDLEFGLGVHLQDLVRVAQAHVIHTSLWSGTRLAATDDAIGRRLTPVDYPKTPNTPAAEASPREPLQRWRLVLARAQLPDGASQRLILDGWDHALATSGLPVCGLDTGARKPRFAFAAPLSPAIPGEAELLDLWLTERAPRWRVREALLAVLPDGWQLADLHDVWLGEPALPGRVVASVFRVTLAPIEAPRSVGLRQAAATLLQAPTLPRKRPKGDATVAYDLRPFLAAIEVASRLDGPVIRLTLRHDPEKGIGRPEEALAALAEAEGGQPLDVRSLVREQIILAEPPPPADMGGRSTPGNLKGRRSAVRR